MKIMVKKLMVFLKSKISLLLSIMPYRFKYWLIYHYTLIRALPKLIKFTFVNISQFEMIGSIVSLEASSICQLKCPICPTGKGINKKGVVGWGYLKFKDFKNFVDNNPSIKCIELSNWGEVFLNPELNQILKYSYNKNINLTVNTGANLNNVKSDLLKSLVKYKLKSLVISIDGATNETYKIYRKGGDLNKVIKNINIINFFKKKFYSEFPEMSWQFVIMGHNEHEISAARKLAQKLGIRFYTKLNKDFNFSPIRNKDLIRRKSRLGVISREEFIQKYQRLYLTFCHQLWTSPQINWDGELLGCCQNIWESYGNVFETSLKRCLNSERYIYAKRMLLGKSRPRNDIPCTFCPHYKFIQKRPLKKREIIINVILF